MPKHLACPHCGARCRKTRDHTTGETRLAALHDKGLLRRLARLEAALARLRAGVKAERLRGAGDN